jgi:hypothetical protein
MITKYWYGLTVVDGWNVNRIVFNGYVKAKDQVEVERVLHSIGRIVEKITDRRLEASVVPITWTRDSGEKSKWGATGVTGVYDSNWKRLNVEQLKNKLSHRRNNKQSIDLILMNENFESSLIWAFPELSS